MSKKNIELIIISLLILYSIYCSLIIGPSWDEFYHYKNGENIFKYIFSLGSREYTSANFKFHFGLYDFLATFFSKNFTSNYIIQAHHIFNLIFSIFSVFGVYQLSKILFNRTVGKIAFIICFLNPIYFGHFSINPKDIIIAFCYIWIFCISIKYLLKQNNNKYLIYLILLISLGLSIRLTFVAILIPIFLIILFDIYLRKEFAIKIIKILRDIFLIIIFSFIITILFWPDTHSNLITLPFIYIKNYFILFMNSDFGIPIGLFNGEFYKISNTPLSYMFVLFFYKMPIYILFSIFLLPLIYFDKIFFISKKIKKINFFYLLLQIIFPILLILFLKPGISDGIRYFLYFIPIISILSALSIHYCFSSRYKIFKLIIGFLFIINIFIFFKLTPYQYIYSNNLNGKFSNYFNKYEIDYWGVSIKELLSNANKEKIFNKNKSYKIATCGVNTQIIKYYLDRDFGLEYKFVNSNETYDYIIFVNRVYNEIGNLDLNKVKTCYDNFFKNDIVTIERNGLPIAFISN